MTSDANAEFEKAWEELSKDCEDFAVEVLQTSWSRALAEVFFFRGYRTGRECEERCED